MCAQNFKSTSATAANSPHGISMQYNNIGKSHNCSVEREMYHVIIFRTAVKNLVLSSPYKDLRWVELQHPHESQSRAATAEK